MSSRTKNIDAEIKQKILVIIDTWGGDLTWDLLINSILKTHLLSYTRQALNKHTDIKDAFTAKKEALRFIDSKTSKKYSSPAVQIAMEQLEKAEALNTRLQAENNKLLEKFAVWLYNASSRGLSEEFLNRPLPTVNREVSKPVLVKVK